MKKLIDSDIYLITDEDGLILATIVDWRLSLAQQMAKTIQDAGGTKTYIHHIRCSTTVPSIGMSCSMKGHVVPGVE